MLIHIMYPGNSYDYVREFMLNNLIETGKIVKFRRTSGWVSIEDDPIRDDKPHRRYYGPEKRMNAQAMTFQKSGLFQTASLIPQ